MSFLKSMTAAMATISIAGCAGIPYDPATNSDSTPPDIGLHIEGQRPDSVYMPNPTPADAQCFPKQSDFCPNNRITPVDLGANVLGKPILSIQMHERGEVSVLATAKDSGSGIKSLKLSCQRQVYYKWDPVNQTEANALLLPEVMERNNQVSNGRVPESAMLQKVMNMYGEMVFQNAQGNPVRGHRAVIKCNAEAKNFNGFGIQSEPVVIWAQDHSIKP